jgi:hypothetical protein
VIKAKPAGGGFVALFDIFSRSARDRAALATWRAEKKTPGRFDIAAMRAAIREARDDLAAGRLRHVRQADDTKNFGPCFNMGIHRTEAGDHSIVGLVGLVERKLGLEVTGMIDVMRDAPENSLWDLWDLFYPNLSPITYDAITPQEAVLAIDAWFAKERDPWGTSVVLQDRPERLKALANWPD